MLESLETHQLHIAPRPRCEILSAPALQFQAEPDVIQHRSPGHQRKILKHDGAIAARTRNRLSVDQNASAGRPQQAGDGQKQTAFPAAARTYDGNEGSTRDIQVCAGDCDQCPGRPGLLVGDSQAFDANMRCGRAPVVLLHGRL